MKVMVDTHINTLASGHAYNTIREMARMAAEKGLEGLAITEHAPEMPGSCHLFYFQNLKVVPRELYGVRLLMGVELNIMDEAGTVDVTQNWLKQMDIAVASIHTPCYGKSKGKDLNTQAYLNVMKNELVDIIGHPDDGRFEVDYEALVENAKLTGTLLEVNNSSLRPDGFRVDTYKNDLEMLKLCKKCGTMITLGSDAHVDIDIANTKYSSAVLKEADFPEKLIANTSFDKLKSVLKRFHYS